MPSLWEGLPLSLVLAMGAGAAGRRDARRRHSRSRRRRRDRPARAAGDAPALGDGARDVCSPIRALRRAARRRPRARSCCRASASTATSTRRRRLRSPARRTRRCSVKLGIVYHMPFWRAADGTLREVEGSFARYVDSLAPYFDEISLCVPVLDEAARRRHARSARRTCTLAPLPYFDGPVQFYPRLPRDAAAHRCRCVRGIDVLHCRVPTPAASFAFVVRAAARQPAFLLVVGDLQALLPTMPYRGVKRLLWRAYTAFEERERAVDGRHSLTFANGAALAAKHSRPGRRGRFRRTTTTIGAGDIATRTDTCRRAARAAAHRQPHRSAQRPARAARGGRAARGARHRRRRSTSSARRSARRARTSAPRSRRTRPRLRRRRSRVAVSGRCRSSGCCRSIATTTCSCCRRCRAKAFRACCSRRWRRACRS